MNHPPVVSPSNPTKGWRWDLIFAALLLGLCLVWAAAVHRYEAVPDQDFPTRLDRWSGEVCDLLNGRWRCPP